MIFSEDFLEKLKTDPLNGTVEMVAIIRSELINDPREWCDNEYQVLLEAYALMCEIAESNLLQINRPPFDIGGNMSEDCKKINAYLSAIEGYCVSEASKLKAGSFRNHFKVFLCAGFTYEFSQGDLELPDHLGSSDWQCRSNKPIHWLAPTPAATPKNVISCQSS